MDRQSILIAAREQLGTGLWSLMSNVEIMLRELVNVPHFDLEDSTAVGAAVHGALPSAFQTSELREIGCSVEQTRSGPANKLRGKLAVDSDFSPFSIEPHYSGPNGGTSKTKHQFAEVDIEEAPEFPEFSAVAPSGILLFLAYNLTPTKTAVNKLYLMFADGVDRKKVELHRPDAVVVVNTGAPEPMVGPRGPKVKVKQAHKGEGGQEDARKADKRGDATSSS